MNSNNDGDVGGGAGGYTGGYNGPGAVGPDEGDWDAGGDGYNGPDAEEKPKIKTSVVYWVWMLCLAELPVIGVVVFYWKKTRLMERGLSPELYSALLSWAWISTAYSILKWVVLAFKVITGVSSFLGIVAEILPHMG